MATPAQQNYILLEPSVSQLPGNLLASTNGKVTIGNNIGDVTSFVFVTLVVASLVAAVFMVMRGSFTRMTTDSIYKHTEGNEMIGRAVFGLLAVLTMYLTILTINPDMLRKGLSLENYKTTGSAIDKAVIQATTPSTPIIQDTLNTPGTVVGDTTNRLTLKNAGFCSNHPVNGNCMGVDCNSTQWGESNPACTSFEELPQSTVDMLLSLKSDCGESSGGSNCPITITGGTEPGHSTHGKGRSPVDLRCFSAINGCDFAGTDTKNLFNFITTKLNKNNLSVGQVVMIGQKSISYCNNIYGPYKGSFFFCDEKSAEPHWHVIGPQ